MCKERHDLNVMQDCANTVAMGTRLLEQNQAELYEQQKLATNARNMAKLCVRNQDRTSAIKHLRTSKLAENKIATLQKISYKLEQCQASMQSTAGSSEMIEYMKSANMLIRQTNADSVDVAEVVDDLAEATKDITETEDLLSAVHDSPVVDDEDLMEEINAMMESNEQASLLGSLRSLPAIEVAASNQSEIAVLSANDTIESDEVFRYATEF